jgi:hypothetical protein
VDSGSVSSFINADLVANLQYKTKLLPPSTYVVANGEKMQCAKYIPQLEWVTQGYTFTRDVKVLALGCYDMILGEDWLDDHSPMWLHCKRKVMRFSHMNRRITLHGVTDNIGLASRSMFPSCKDCIVEVLLLMWCKYNKLLMDMHSRCKLYKMVLT